MTARRLDKGGLIDRHKPVRFTYDGENFTGYEGDTLASALLATDTLLMGRSFKYHRPRGVLSAGAEEPNALIQLEEGAFSAPNIRATQIELYEGLKAKSQNAWPSVKHDLSSINNVFSKFLPAGFYYKTFMWPASMWMTYEKIIRKMAGLGKVSLGKDPEHYDHRYHHADIVIVGSGPTGLMAALAAARSGAKTLLIEQDNQPGGTLLSENDDTLINNQTGITWVKKVISELLTHENVTLLMRTTLAGAYDDNFLIACEDRLGHIPLPERGKGVRQRLHKIRAQRIILATGAFERPLTFENNDLPGILLAESAKTYINRYGILPGCTMVIATNNDRAYDLAVTARKAGAAVTIIDCRQKIDAERAASMVNLGVAVHTSAVIVAAHGHKRIKSAVLARLNDDGSSTVGAQQRLECDILAMSGGFNPVVNLHSQARGKLNWRDGIQAFVPEQADRLHHQSAGACNGSFGLKACLDEGWLTGVNVLKSLGLDAGNKPRLSVKANAETTPLRMIWRTPGSGKDGQVKAKQFVDFQNDVASSDIDLAAREGFLSVEHLKRYTTMGMATDQGKTSNVTALAMMAENRRMPVPDVGTTTFRPPFTPLPFGAMSGQHRDDLYTPVRKTPMHESEVMMGAKFEPVGDWMRAYYYPKPGETFDQAVRRECLAVRQNVGMFDGSTLGKIDVQGRDAATFLNMIYTNAWRKLGINQCRYGLMLDENGMVYDDGVTTRLSENHYHMTTTTGGAARVLNFMEEWLQTEWPELDVYCTSVTETWAVIALAGPKARDVLASLTDIDVSNEAFPFMSMREGRILGVETRIFRISFSGEIGYEINIPARFGRYIWDEINARGQAFDITPYGTETMHVLRAEKGFIIVGQDTDGTVTPSDLGMDWIVSKTKDDFIGKRSLKRSDTMREGRKQLVGLLPVRKDFMMPRGVHFVEKANRQAPPFEHIGHASSRYFSPSLGRTFGLGMIKNGRARIGDTIYARTLDGREEAVEVTNPVFIDPEGGRVRG